MAFQSCCQSTPDPVHPGARRQEPRLHRRQLQRRRCCQEGPLGENDQPRTDGEAWGQFYGYKIKDMFSFV
jgi:hypothetical protein